MLVKKVLVIGVLLVITVLAPVSAQGKETLAVLDFTTEAVSKTEMGAIVEFLSAELFNTDKYIVIDVSQRETILKEMEFSLQGCSDDSCALEIGKMLSAEMIVTGNLSKVGSRYLMSVKMLETETSRTMGTANGKFRDLDELIDGLEVIALTLTGMEDEVKTVVQKPVEKAPEPEPEPVMEPDAEQEAETAEALSVDDRSAVEAAGEDAEEKKADEAVESSGGSKIAAISCTAGGITAIGIGGYFLFDLFTNSLPAYRDAKVAYDYAYGDSETTDYQGLFDASNDAYDDAFTDLIIGAGAAGIGLVLTTVGIILFPPKDKGAQVSFSPVIYNNPGLVIRVSY